MGSTEDYKKNSSFGVLSSLGFSQIICIYQKEKLSINSRINKNIYRFALLKLHPQKKTNRSTQTFCLHDPSHLTVYLKVAG